MRESRLQLEIRKRMFFISKNTVHAIDLWKVFGFPYQTFKDLLRSHDLLGSSLKTKQKSME